MSGSLKIEIVTPEGVVFSEDALLVGLPARDGAAVAVDKIDEAKAEEARERAAARLRDKISDEEVASVNASLARSLAQLRVKRRHRA